MKQNVTSLHLEKRIEELERKLAQLQKSEHRYKKIIEHLPISVFAKDIKENYSYILWNRELEKVFGKKASEVLGKTDSEVLDNEIDINNVRNSDLSILKSKNIKNITHEELNTAKGKAVFHTRKIPIFDDNNQPELILGCLDDITDKIKIEKLLRESEEHYRLLVDNLKEMILLLDLNGNVLFANPATESITGYSPEDVLNHNIIDYIGDSSKNLVIENLRKRNSGSELNFKYQLEIKSKKNKILLIEANSSPVKKDDKVVGIMFMAIDISAQKKIEQKLAKMRQHFEVALEATSSSSFDYNFINNDLSVSDELFKFLEYKEKDIPKKFNEFTDILHPTDIPELNNAINKHISGSTTSYYSEFRIGSKSGRWIWCSGAGKIIEWDKNKKPKRLVGMITVIEERKNAEFRLRKSEEFNRQITENMVDLIAQFDLEFNWRYASPSFKKVLGYLPNEILSKKLIEYVHPDEVNGILADLRNILTNEKGTVQFRFINNAGEYRWLEAAGKMIYNKTNKPAYSIIGFRDITDRKIIELELRESEAKLKIQNEEFQALNEEYFAQNEELAKSFSKLTELNKELGKAKTKAEESDKLKSAFLANMSHEIRTPMNAIVGFADLLKDPDVQSDKMEKYVNIINSNSHHLLTLINDIIDISKIEAGQVKLSNSSINLNDIMREMLSVFKTLALRKNIDITLRYSLPNVESNIEADETRVKQILTNLLNNALKFTQKGKIDFGYSIINSNIRFFVNDTGIGIDTDNFNLVFERFRQVESHLTKKVGGTGLGLSISKALVELMGGQIWVESEKDKGSTFYFEIPFVQTGSSLLVANEDKSQEEITDWSNFTILIAEDEEANYFYLQEILSNTKAKLIHAKNGLEAIELFNGNALIDLVLMDIKMPKMDGYEATRKIKELNPNIHVIAQTAYAMADDKKKAFLAGCDGYISKPIDKKTLMDEMKHCFKNKNK